PINAAGHGKYVIKMPLEPGKYFVRLAVVKKNGLQTDYSPARPIVISGAKRFLETTKILDAAIIDEASDAAVTGLQPEKWYLLTARLSQIKDCFALFYLHHSDFIDAGPYNKGGYFDRTSNYIFNFSFGGNNWFYASQESIKGRNIRVDGQKYLYIDDSDNRFQVDTTARTVCIRFKLLNEAKPGRWKLSGYLEQAYTPDRSFLFEKTYTVLSERESAERELRHKKQVHVAVLLILLSLLAIGGISIALWRKKTSSAETPVSLLATLRDKGIYILNENHKNRHLVQRMQAYMLENISRPLSLNDVSVHLDRTPTWTGIVFKEATGFTVVQFINRIKIERACELLKEGSLSATDIAMSTGYASLDHFRRVFKEQTGLTPTDYKKRMMADKATS
ncbi:MAG: AraC family transcriptional regulator, partial [Fibrobacterota bacterium]